VTINVNRRLTIGIDVNVSELLFGVLNYGFEEVTDVTMIEDKELEQLARLV